MCCWKGLDIDNHGSCTHELSYFGSLSDEQLVVGVAEVPEVEGIGDDQAQAPPVEVGPIAAPQLEGKTGPDEIVIVESVLKPTSAVVMIRRKHHLRKLVLLLRRNRKAKLHQMKLLDLRAAAKFLGVSQAGSKVRIF